MCNCVLVGMYTVYIVFVGKKCVFVCSENIKQYSQLFYNTCSLYELSVSVTLNKTKVILMNGEVFSIELISVQLLMSSYDGLCVSFENI